MDNSDNLFADIGDLIFKQDRGVSDVVRRRRLSALFGATPTSCWKAWKMIENSISIECAPKHLL